MLWSTTRASARARRSRAPASDVGANWDHEGSGSRDPGGVDISFFLLLSVYCDHERCFIAMINLSTAVRTERLFAAVQYEYEVSSHDPFFSRGRATTFHVHPTVRLLPK